MTSLQEIQFLSDNVIVNFKLHMYLNFYNLLWILHTLQGLLFLNIEIAQ